MKNKLQLVVIGLFLLFLWVPLVSTPFRVKKEHRELRGIERRDPPGKFRFKGCGGIEGWVRYVQPWYENSFGFRADFMRVYNVFNYRIHNFTRGVYGPGGTYFRNDMVDRVLEAVPEENWQVRAQSLDRIRELCEQTQTPCLFVVIPSKSTAHPDWAPKWLQKRNFGDKRQRMMELIRSKGFPALDLCPFLISHAEQIDEDLFLRFDIHWSVPGALVGYAPLVSTIQQWIPEARLVQPEAYTLTVEKDNISSARRHYLESVCSEDITRITGIDLPPVRIIKDGEESNEAVAYFLRRHFAEVFCEGLGDRTVVFVRDSFLREQSPLLNHSFGHTVYLNNSNEGQDPAKVIEKWKPDLLVFAMQELLMRDYLERMAELPDSDFQ